jgi:hypothetical protein
LIVTPQKRVQLEAGGHMDLAEARHARVAAPANAVQHQAVKVNVEIGGRHEALDQCDGASVPFVSLEPSAAQHMARDHALHHLQHWRDQLGLRGQQHAQRDRQGQHPLPHRHVRHDVVHQMRRRLRYAPRVA